MTGIIISIFLINKDEIVKFLNYININTKLSKIDKTNDRNKKDNYIQKVSYTYPSIKETSKLTLVEEIEEYGFIPSIDQGNKKI